MDIIPEAFGLVVISHLAPSGSISLPDTFSVQSANGDWQTVPIKDEPIFTAALLIAQNMFHNGPRECFKNISYRSALLDAVNNALNKADSNLASLEGSTLSGPNFFGIPAEIYE